MDPDITLQGVCGVTSPSINSSKDTPDTVRTNRGLIASGPAMEITLPGFMYPVANNWPIAITSWYPIDQTVREELGTSKKCICVPARPEGCGPPKEWFSTRGMSSISGTAPLMALQTYTLPWVSSEIARTPITKESNCPLKTNEASGANGSLSMAVTNIAAGVSSSKGILE